MKKKDTEKEETNVMKGKGRHYRNGKNERVRREGVKKEKRERAEREQLDDCTGGRKKKEE